MQPTWTSIKEAVRLLQSKEIVAIPTETVYGLAGNALETLALAKIFEAKGRPTFDPLIVHIAEHSTLNEIAQNIPPQAHTLAQAFWPGPLTMVLPKKPCIPDLATSGLPSVAIRFPAHPIAQEIIRLCGFPLAAPSANLFKRLSPTRPEHILEQLGHKISGIVDGGTCSVGVESTIVSFKNETVQILRPGAITPSMIQALVQKVTIQPSNSAPGKAMASPGSMDTHYQPRTPLHYNTKAYPKPLPPNTVRLAFADTQHPLQATLNLSKSGNLLEATANLYDYLHRLDRVPHELILVDPIPNEGLGIALNDRLTRASLK
ncbi:MAG: threonylcarbamoyl-AMP synthase [Fibrobacter sp.]|jgi:L-threonylcarbamoyladenylate synthase|nr:threonylcarbamoyl-AMP synthase [Fibrobacter sp.]